MTTPVLIWAGALAPESYELALTSDDIGVDLSNANVTAEILRVRDPAGNETTWAVTSVYNDTTKTRTLTHVFDATTSELTTAGVWSVYAELTVTSPAGKVRSRPRGVVVRERFAIAP